MPNHPTLSHLAFLLTVGKIRFPHLCTVCPMCITRHGVGKVVRPGQEVGSGAVNGTFASVAALRTALSQRSTTPKCRSRHHTCRESAVRGTKHMCRHTNTTLPTPWCVTRGRPARSPGGLTARHLAGNGA